MDRLQELVEKSQICAVIGPSGVIRHKVLSALNADCNVLEPTDVVCGEFTQLSPSKLVELFLPQKPNFVRGRLEGEKITPEFCTLWLASTLTKVLILSPGVDLDRVLMLYPQHKVAIKGMAVAQHHVSGHFSDLIVVSDMAVRFNRLHYN